MQNINQVSRISLPRIEDKRGCLSIIEQCKQIPFTIKKVRWYSLSNETVNLEVLKTCDRCLVALSGKVDLVVYDNVSLKHYNLDSPSTAMYVPYECSVDVSNFSEDAVLLVLTSDSFEM